MVSLSKKLFSPSLRLNSTVLWEVLLLMLVSLAVIFYYSRQMLRQEAMDDATETLEGAALQVDNVLRSVEQSAGNIFWDLQAHLNEPERMLNYSRRMVECNTNITGCAIAFKPGYYPGHEQFMAYIHRKTYDSPELISSEQFAGKSYLEQSWYLETMEKGRAGWMSPLAGEDAKGNSLISFCIPIFDRSRLCVGVFAVDVSIDMLTQIVLASKPSPNSYCVLIDSVGSYIIHPDRSKWLGKTVFSRIEGNDDPAAIEAAEAMMAGQTGSMAFQMGGEYYHVFYKPFVRSNMSGCSQGDLKWSIGIVYPEDDISGAYKHLFLQMLGIAAVGLFVFFLLCRLVIRAQMKPLRRLARRAHDIAEGNYEKIIPKTRRNDEIGRFQQHFKQMQEMLAMKVSEQDKLTATLEEHRETLRKTYEQVQEANHIKLNFLQNMTNQIIAPSEAVSQSVANLCDNYQAISQEEARREVDAIKQQDEIIFNLVDKMLHTSKSGKEEHYE